MVVNPNDTQTLHFTNAPSTTLVIEKYIEGTTTPLKGVTFLVTDSSGSVVGNSNGCLLYTSGVRGGSGLRISPWIWIEHHRVRKCTRL